MLNVLGLEAHNEREALANLLDSLRIAENAARQLALHTEQPQWVLLAETFNASREICSRLGRKSFLT